MSQGWGREKLRDGHSYCAGKADQSGSDEEHKGVQFGYLTSGQIAQGDDCITNASLADIHRQIHV
jgi:hypothetical protein